MLTADLPSVVFYAMTKKGFIALRAFVERYGSQTVECVVGSRDEATQADFYDDILTYCAAQQIPFYDRKTVISLKSKHAFAIGWRWMIREQGFKLVVFHDSILPRYRGFAPLVNGLINGEPELGVTALLAAEEYDCGAILAQARIPVRYPLKIAAAVEQVSTLYAELTIAVYEQILRGESLQGIPQDEAAATYSLWRDNDDYLIDWHSDAAAIQRHVDAVGYPYLGAATNCNDKLIRVLAVEVLNDVRVELRQPGKVLSIDQAGRPTVVCGQGLVKIIEAIDETTKESILPLKRFRVRFR